jgi:hypothetical protein
MCIKCAKAEAEAKEQAAVEAKAAAEAKARAEAEEKAAAEKAAGVRGLLRYIMPSCVYGGGCDEVMFDTIPVLSTQGGGREDETCCSSEMSTDINEFYVFHGTSLETAELIRKGGVDQRMGSLNSLYGAGSYFAINSCKSHQYSSAKASQKGNTSNLVMLVCRVAMGSPYCTATSHKRLLLPPENPATPGRPFDSIFAEHGIANGGQQHHNEYVVFDRHQVYPEYIVQYTV